MEAIRVSTKLFSQVRDDALRGNPLFSIGSMTSTNRKDTADILLYTDPVALQKGAGTSVATSRMQAPVRSPVTITRPGQHP